MALSQPKTLVEAANSDDIEALYILLKQNPFLLEEIDAIPFADTPLHFAAASGSTRFAIEVLTLKPSLGQKLNPDGFSPLHVALRSGKTKTARRLMDWNPELIRVKGKEGYTPLHYVAEADDLVLLELFLEANPKAIQDLNTRRETAVHIAVKSGNLNALKVLLGWLFVTNNLYTLNQKDDNDNVALHIAVSTNNYEMVRLLIPKMRINEQNEDGLTALDIARGVPNSVANARIEKALLTAGARTHMQMQLPPSQTDRTVSHYADVALRKLSPDIILAYLKRIIVSSVESWSEETRNNLLVVTGLIIAATYQAVLSPPGGLTSGDGTSVIPSDQKTANISSLPGRVNMGMEWYALLLGCNSISFASAMGFLILLLPQSELITAFFVYPLFALSMSYGFSYGIINPLRNAYSTIFMGVAFGVLNIPFVWLKIYSGEKFRKLKTEDN